MDTDSDLYTAILEVDWRSPYCYRGRSVPYAQVHGLYEVLLYSFLYHSHLFKSDLCSTHPLYL